MSVLHTHISAYCLICERSLCLKVFGSDGMLISENQRETELVHHHSKGASIQPIKYSFPQRYKESYIGALEHFVDVVRGWFHY